MVLQKLTNKQIHVQKVFFIAYLAYWIQKTSEDNIKFMTGFKSSRLVNSYSVRHENGLWCENQHGGTMPFNLERAIYFCGLPDAFVSLYTVILFVQKANGYCDVLSMFVLSK